MENIINCERYDNECDDNPCCNGYTGDIINQRKIV